MDQGLLAESAFGLLRGQHPGRRGVRRGPLPPEVRRHAYGVIHDGSDGGRARRWRASSGPALEAAASCRQPWTATPGSTTAATQADCTEPAEEGGDCELGRRPPRLQGCRPRRWPVSREVDRCRQRLGDATAAALEKLGVDLPAMLPSSRTGASPTGKAWAARRYDASGHAGASDDRRPLKHLGRRRWRGTGSLAAGHLLRQVGSWSGGRPHGRRRPTA